MLPSETNLAFRASTDVSVDFWGLDVNLYLLTNFDSIIDLDAYKSAEDKQYQLIQTKCRLEWVENVYKLKKLGLYNEKYLPILAYFKSSIDIPLGSYFTIDIAYMPSLQVDTDKFEIVDDSILGMSDIEFLRVYKIAPKRDQSGN